MTHTSSFLFPSTSHPRHLVPNYCYLSQRRVPCESAPDYLGLQAKHRSKTLTNNSDELIVIKAAIC